MGVYDTFSYVYPTNYPLTVINERILHDFFVVVR